MLFRSTREMEQASGFHPLRPGIDRILPEVIDFAVGVGAEPGVVLEAEVVLQNGGDEAGKAWVAGLGGVVEMVGQDYADEPRGVDGLVGYYGRKNPLVVGRLNKACYLCIPEFGRHEGVYDILRRVAVERYVLFALLRRSACQKQGFPSGEYGTGGNEDAAELVRGNQMDKGNGALSGEVQEDDGRILRLCQG